MLFAGCVLTVSGCGNVPVKTDTNVSEADTPVTARIATDKVTPVTGKYYNKITPIIFIELNDDGTFCDRFGKRSKCGTYVINGNRVILTMEKSKTIELTIEGNSLVFSDGAKYTKQ
jgi:hypothetical protein